MVQGRWSLWQPWGPCTGSCGSGSQTRIRTCTNPFPRNSCLGANSQSRRCNPNSCSGKSIHVDGGRFLFQVTGHRKFFGNLMLLLLLFFFLYKEGVGGGVSSCMLWYFLCTRRQLNNLVCIVKGVLGCLPFTQTTRKEIVAINTK